MKKYLREIDSLIQFTIDYNKNNTFQNVGTVSASPSIHWSRTKRTFDWIDWIEYLNKYPPSVDRFVTDDFVYYAMMMMMICRIRWQKVD